jgi:hypothetical protein
MQENQPLTKNAMRETELLENVVLVAGVHGVSGLAAARHWVSMEGTRVYGLCHRTSTTLKRTLSECANKVSRGTGRLFVRKPLLGSASATR